MELIYAWVEKFRNYRNVELKFSDRFIINYNDLEKEIRIEPNEEYFSFYPNHITNINALVGRNGVGKTNLLDLLGLRMDDRNKNNSEYELRHKNGSKLKGIHNSKDIVDIKNSIYFFVYYLGKDEEKEDIFCFEGNDIESYRNLLESKIDIQELYRKEKYWFPFICNYRDNKFFVKYDLNEKLGEYETKNYKDGIRVYGDYRSEKDKVAVISLRENLNSKYYDNNSIKPKDDYKICVPRRVYEFNSRFLENKIRMLYNQLNIPKREMFKDDEYILKISFNSFYLDNLNIEEDTKILSHSYKELRNKNEKNICRVLESYVYLYYSSLRKNEGLKDIDNQLLLIELKNKSLNDFVSYYIEIVTNISKGYFKETADFEHAVKCFENMAKELVNNTLIKFKDDGLELKINIKSNIEEIIKFIRATIDEKEISEFNETFPMFHNFFDFIIEEMSDGEIAYLGLFASLYEQISMLTPNKERYIILLDEPEARMHPELTRKFTNYLISFLNDIAENKKKFQIIMSTHSPFILSDIKSENIIYLEKDKKGYCLANKNKIKTFGANIHNLLKDGFFMDSTMGEYAINKIKEIIKFIDETNVNQITCEQRRENLYFIKSIGESLIANKLLKMFEDKFSLDYTSLYSENIMLKNKLKEYENAADVNYMIENLKKQAEKLQEYINLLEADSSDKN